MSCNHLASPNPRSANDCVICGKPIPMRPRNLDLERELTESAAKAGGYILPDGRGDTGGLLDLAEYRARPGGVRTQLNDLQETREEFADARNYLVWGVEPIYERYLAGDPEACDLVVPRMNSLMRLIQAWQELRA